MNRIKAYVHVYKAKINYRCVLILKQIGTQIRFTHVPWILTLVLVSPSQSPCTAIVVVRQGRAVYLGADARVSSFGENAPESHCKIIQIATGQFVAISGLLNLNSYNIFPILFRSVAADIRMTADLFAINSRDPIQRLAQSLLDDPSINTKAYHWFVETNHPILDAVFVGADKASASYHIRGFRVKAVDGVDLHPVAGPLRTVNLSR